MFINIFARVNVDVTFLLIYLKIAVCQYQFPELHLSKVAYMHEIVFTCESRLESIDAFASNGAFLSMDACFTVCLRKKK